MRFLGVRKRKTWSFVISIAFFLLLVCTSKYEGTSTDQLGETADMTYIVSDWPPPATGDWIIDSEVIVTSQIFEMNGRILITSTGHLSLTNCDVTMNSQADWLSTSYIHVEEGGELTLDNTDISSGTPYRWYIQADGGSRVDIQGCELESNYPLQDSFLDNFYAVINCGGWPTYEPCEFVSIKNNQIHDLEGAAISVNAEEATVTGNDIDRVMGTGISIDGCPNGEVTHNAIHEVSGHLWRGRDVIGYGISIGNPANVNVSHNTISDVSTRGFRWRVYDWGVGPEVGLSDFNGNTVDGQPILYLQSATAQTITGGYPEAILYDCEDITIEEIDGNGITVSYSPDTTVRDCTLTKGGLTAYESDNFQILDTTISDFVEWSEPIDIAYSNHILVENNTIIEPENAGGIYVRYCEDVEIIRNRVEKSLGWGITVIDDNEVLVSENTIIESAWDAICVTRSTNTHVIANTILRSTTDKFNFFADSMYIGISGISLTDADDTLVERNNISWTISDGIYAYGSNNLRILENEVSHTPGRGIFLYGCMNPVLSYNTITNASWMGMAFFACHNASVTSNRLYDIPGAAYVWYNRYESNRMQEFEDNLLDGRLFGFYQDLPFAKASSDLAGVIMINCSNGVVADVIGNTVTVTYSPGVTVRNCVLAGGGIGMYYSENATVAGCQVDDTPYHNLTVTTYSGEGWISWGLCGIEMYRCAKSMVVGNRVNNTGRDSIYAFYSVPIDVVGNTLSHSNENGVCLHSSREATISYNRINNTKLSSVCLRSSSSVTLYMNHFGSALNSSTIDNSRYLQWHNGTHGNFWFEYDGNDTNSDGIGDTPFQIDLENEDPFPLMTVELIGTDLGNLLSLQPQITSFNITPSSPVDTQNVTVIVHATSFSGIAEVTLSYSSDGGVSWINTTLMYDGTTWSVTLPLLPAGTVRCIVYVEDNLGNEIMYDAGVIEIVASLNIPMIVAVSALGGVAIVGLVVILKRRS
jgi:parallel beta-helix repeat protein